MEMSNKCTIPASVEVTWQALNAPQFLKDCITGCESIEQVGDNEFKVLMNAKIGPVNARFAGRMLLSDLDPPKGYAITFEGQGGAAGFAKGRARVDLAPDDDGAATLMTYQVQAQVGGKLAQIGARLIDGAARKVADEFFAAFTAKIASQQSGAGDASEPTGEMEATSAEHNWWRAHPLRWTLLALAVAGAVWLLAR